MQCFIFTDVQFVVSIRSMFFRQLKLGHMENFSYLIGCEDTREAAVIDCGFSCDVLIKEAENNGYTIRKIFLTHFHYDHSQEAELLSSKTGAEIFGHEQGNEKRKENVYACVIPKEFTPLRDGDEISVGNIRGKVIHTPGHQSDHICLLFKDYLMTGDMLFIGSVGRIDLPDSNPDDMEESIKKLKSFPDTLIVYPGHDYGDAPFQTLGEEKKGNPFFQV